jgi:hypothetical protein
MGSSREEMFAGIGIKTRIPPLATGMALDAPSDPHDPDLMIDNGAAKREIEEALSLLFDALSGKCFS